MTPPPRRALPCPRRNSRCVDGGQHVRVGPAPGQRPARRLGSRFCGKKGVSAWVPVGPERPQSCNMGYVQTQLQAVMMHVPLNTVLKHRSPHKTPSPAALRTRPRGWRARRVLARERGMFWRESLQVVPSMCACSVNLSRCTRAQFRCGHKHWTGACHGIFNPEI